MVSRVRRAKLFLIAALAVIAAVFVLQNSQHVTAHSLTYTVTAPLALTLFGTLASGCLLGSLVTLLVLGKSKAGPGASSE